MTEKTKIVRSIRSGQTALRDSSVLRRVGSLGSGRSGLAGWRMQRLTAIALVPLGLYFVASVLHLATDDRETAAAWLSWPVNALVMLLSIIAMFAHASVGLRSIFADYMHERSTLLLASLVTNGMVIVLAFAGVLAVLNALLGH